MTFQQSLKHFESKWHRNGIKIFSLFFFLQETFPWRIVGLILFWGFLFSRGTNPWSLPPKAAVVKPVLIEVQIKTGPSNIIAFQTGERAADGAAHLLRKRVQQLLQFFFFFPSKGAATNPQNRFCFQQPAPPSHFIILVFLRLSQCGFSPPFPC